MTESKDPQVQQEHPGLFAGVLSLVKNLVGLIANRIELASLELSEVGGNLIKFQVLFAVTAIALWFAVAFWSVLLVFLAWNAWGWKILLVLGLFFSLVAVIVGWRAYALLSQGKLSLPLTMAELRKDRDALL